MPWFREVMILGLGSRFFVQIINSQSFNESGFRNRKLEASKKNLQFKR